jgi:hypothetical protein
MRWLCLFLIAGCVVAKQSLTMPPNDVTTVALLTGALPHPMDGIARHPWFAVRRAGETDWQIYEVGGGGREQDPFTQHTSYLDPMLHAVWRGAEADRAADCLAAHGDDTKYDIQRHYVFYPGPNSNTYGDRMLRQCKLHASLPSTSVGKDWRGWIGGGVTSEGTGLQLETPLFGIKVGLKEGIEVHIIGLSIGVDFWPPAIILPLGPGRLGFADR